MKIIGVAPSNEPEELVEEIKEEPYYTEDDEKEGLEFRDSRRNNRLINKELTQYSWKIKREFEKLFPCKNPLITIEVSNREYDMEQKMISVQLKVDKLRGEEVKEYKNKYSMETISFESHESFWKNWKRFQKFNRLIF